MKHFIENHKFNFRQFTLYSTFIKIANRKVLRGMLQVVLQSLESVEKYKETSSTMLNNSVYWSKAEYKREEQDNAQNAGQLSLVAK